MDTQMLEVYAYTYTYIPPHALTVITMNDLDGRSSSFAVLDWYEDHEKLTCPFKFQFLLIPVDICNGVG